MGMHRKLILFCLAAAVSPAAVRDRVKVETGVVKGAVDNGVAAFKGIPFAAPPVGALRWKAPQPALTLERRPRSRGVRPALHAGADL
jgi:para-nitrobenzyl esterase